MSGAIFDAIFVHLMNTVLTPDVWQSLKKTMVESLKQKVPHTLDILRSVYGSSEEDWLQWPSKSDKPMQDFAGTIHNDDEITTVAGRR